MFSAHCNQLRDAKENLVVHLDTSSGCTFEVRKPHHIRVASKLRRPNSWTPGPGPGRARHRQPEQRDPLLPDRRNQRSKTIVTKYVLQGRIGDVQGGCTKTMPGTCTSKSAGTRKKLHNQMIRQTCGNVRIDVGSSNSMTNCAGLSAQTTLRSR